MNDLRWRELVEKTRQGDKQAFEQLYNETNRSVYFTALKLLKDEDNAKDVMQDTFMAAIEKLSDLDDGAKFPKWVNSIAVNKCRRYFRKAKEDSLEEQTEQGFDPKDDAGFIPEEYVTDAAKRKVIMDIIQNVLSDVQRQAVIMFYYDEMSLEEIAAAMDCPAKTVSSRLCSAREKIREAVLIYERKQGDRLHAVVPVPILTLILRKEAEVLSVPDIPLEIFSALLSDAAAGASANMTAVIAGGSTKMGGFLTGKVIAAIAAGVIAVGGATTAVVLANSDKDSKSSSSVSVSAAADSKDDKDSSTGSISENSTEDSSEQDPADESSKADDSEEETDEWDFKALTIVMSSTRGKTIAEAEKIIEDVFGVPKDKWETLPRGSVTEYVNYVPNGIKVLGYTFHRLVLSELTGTGTIVAKGNAVSIGEDYDDKGRAEIAAEKINKKFAEMLTPDKSEFYNIWFTDVGRVTCSATYGTNRWRGYLAMGFREMPE